MRQRVLEQWNTFRAVLPPNAHPIQVTEMRRAFYAGAYAMLSLTHQLSHESESEEAAVTALTEIQRECEAFAERVGKDGY